MNADRRIVPSHHVSTVLAEDSISERTIECKNTLKHSPNKYHKVAHKWMTHDGINSMARVILTHVEEVPATEKKHNHDHVNSALFPPEKGDGKIGGKKGVEELGLTGNAEGLNDHGNTDHAESAHLEKHHEPTHHGHHETKSHKDPHHDDHGHGHAEIDHTNVAHGHDAHNTHGTSHDHHSHSAHEHHDDHGQDNHGHSAHDHGHHGHGHTDHGHGHGNEHGHGGKFASFISTGHWFGDHGAYIFGLIGRALGEVVGYTLKLFGVLMLFGPTRTALLVVIAASLLNIWIGSSLPVWLSAGGCLIIHLIFSFMGQIGGGGGEHGGGHGGHSGGHEDHGHH